MVVRIAYKYKDILQQCIVVPFALRQRSGRLVPCHDTRAALILPFGLTSPYVVSAVVVLFADTVHLKTRLRSRIQLLWTCQC